MARPLHTTTDEAGCSELSRSPPPCGVLVGVAHLAERAFSTENAPQPLARRGDVVATWPAEVVGSADPLAARAGDRCEVSVYDTGERDGRRTCVVEVACPSFDQRSNVAPCSSGRVEALRVEGDEIALDVASRFVTVRGGSGALVLRLLL